MHIEQLKPFYEKLKNNDIIFSFSGPMSQIILESLCETIRKKLSLDATGFGTIQRVFSILVEQAQNILNYSAEISPPSGEGGDHIRSGILVLGLENRGYFVCCGNYVAAENVASLTRELAMLGSLSPDAVKQLYRERRKARSTARQHRRGTGPDRNGPPLQGAAIFRNHAF